MAKRKKPETAGGEAKYVRDMVRLLDELTATHTELLEAVREKLAAMKRADLHTMREMTIKEQTLARTIQEQEGLRRQLADIIGKKIGLTSGEARTWYLRSPATSARQIWNEEAPPRRRRGERPGGSGKPLFDPPSTSVACFILRASVPTERTTTGRGHEAGPSGWSK